MREKKDEKKSLYGQLITNSVNCSWGDEETILISDVFILDMLDIETQNQLLKETATPAEALETAIHMESGAQNQKQTKTGLISICYIRY